MIGKCGMCKFSEADGDSLQCRRYPPTVQVVPVPRTGLDGRTQMHLQPMVAWPIVQSMLNCGEYTSKLVLSD